MRAVDTSPGVDAKQRPNSEPSARYDEHTMSVSEICDVYDTHFNQTVPEFSNGLSSGEASNRLRENGRNDLTPPKQTSNLRLFLLQFTDTFMILLELVAFLSLLSWSLENPRNPTDLYIGLFLVFVICAQSFWMYKQETHSAILMEKFRTLAPQFCICIRDGNQMSVRSEALVVGDLVKLTSGSKIPADCRLVKIYSADVFKVDQSSITGESEPVCCNCAASREKTAFEAYNIVFGGSLVVEGEALAIVIRTGDKTLLGHTARMTGGYERKLSTLQADVDAFVYTVAKIAISMGIFVFLLGIMRGMPIFESLMDGLIGMLNDVSC
jgi:sodium/potassium-transporting ATPase subunit alpha